MNHFQTIGENKFETHIKIRNFKIELLSNSKNRYPNRKIQ